MINASALDSWQDLVDRLTSFLARRLPAQEVDDVRQDVLMRIHRNLTQLDDESRFGPWVYSIARNAIVDHFRRRTIQTLDSLERPEAEAPSADEEDASPLVDCVVPFVARLPSPYREAVTLVELQGVTQLEAAKMAGVSLSGMKSRVQRGRRLLRVMFEECCHLTIDGRGHVIDTERRGSAGCEEPCTPARRTS
jgi:RNA polymerase sigma-70 factor (ECF subfamily)